MIGWRNLGTARFVDRCMINCDTGKEKMVVVNQGSTFKPRFQEKLAKEDVDLLILAIWHGRDALVDAGNSHTRLEMMIEKLERMKGK